jgi:ABC-type glutathione transport system ATPase component
MNDIVLSVRDVTREFGGRRRLFRPAAAPVRAVDGVSIDVVRGRTLGIVGESGSGKSTLARMMVGLLPLTAGEIALDGRSVSDLLKEDRRALYRRVQMVFQDPFGSLNPRKTVRQILEAPLKALHRMEPRARRARVQELMALVRLRAEFADRYPHEFSGGQCQRIGIARALAADPELIVLDEPVSALDVSVQAQILALLDDLQARLNLTFVFISHDLAVVETISSEVAVMYRGKIVERGSRSEIFAAPKHDYTRLLLSSIPGNAAAKAA